ncbi:hypothetical protein QF048_007645 [Streptomyces sp. W4I9-2]|nr:hypothetical protein [Streptomyces sp. W4I9-2]
MDGDSTEAVTELPMRLLLVSDTHVPLRAKWLPDELLCAVDRADVVVHAGDWVDVATLDLMEGRARRLVGVYGNNDGPQLRSRLPEVARVELGGLRFGVVHETGAARGREARCSGCPGLRPQPHPLGHRGAGWTTPAQPRFPDGPQTAAVLHVHDMHGG